MPAAEGMAAGGWWRCRTVLRRFVADLVEGELVRQRRSATGRARPWPQELAFDADLGVDSLELLGLAAALAESLHLHESGIEDYLLRERTLGGWLDVAQAGLERHSSQLTFRTSGSNGAPKACRHSLAGLQQEVEHHARVVGNRRRVLSAVPSHHIYGFLFNLLLPRALGLGADAFVDLRDSSPAWLARGARPGDLVVAHPDYWQAVARAVPSLAPDVVGVTSTAPCPDAVSAAVEAAGIARLVHVYGCSESGGIGWRSGWRDPYRLLPHWDFVQGEDRLVRRRPDGSAEEIACQDRLDRLGEDLFRVAGRRDEAVQVGGVNVFPSRVVAALLEHPLVEQAAVRLMRPDEGSRLKAFVVPAAGVQGEALLRELDGWTATRLTAAQRPRAIRIGGRLPVGAGGKAADWSIDGKDAAI
ncbi:AMP-binding protein [Caenimonas terrae]|uniref:AMP-binding protein n=1 Tax=Caenimonas terrae TaxID=696074 RepID=A0ABW0N697_9BURK